MTEPEQHVEVPAGPALENQAWTMIAAEGGGLALVLGLAVVALWRVVSKVLSEGRDQNKVLVEAQTKGMADLRDSVRAMDTANQLGLQRVTDAVGHATARLDRHEQKLDAHGRELHAFDRRLTVVESARTG